MSNQDDADRRLGRAVAETLGLEVGDSWEIHNFVSQRDKIMVQKVEYGDKK